MVTGKVSKNPTVTLEFDIETARTFSAWLMDGVVWSDADEDCPGIEKILAAVYNALDDAIMEVE